MSAVEVNVIRWQNNSMPPQVLPAEEEEAFNASAPYGYTRISVFAVQVNSAWFALADWCPKEGMSLWSHAAHEAKEKEEEEALLALPPLLREKFAPGYVTLEARKAQRAAEDAEAVSRRNAMDRVRHDR